jgi:hypothetical protein
LGVVPRREGAADRADGGTGRLDAGVQLFGEIRNTSLGG